MAIRRTAIDHETAFPIAVTMFSIRCAREFNENGFCMDCLEMRKRAEIIGIISEMRDLPRLRNLPERPSGLPTLF